LNYTREEIFDFRLPIRDLQAASSHCQEITSPEPEKLFTEPPSAVKAGGPGAAGPPPNAPFLPNDHTITPK